MLAKKRLSRKGETTIKEIIGLLLALGAIILLLPIIAAIVSMILPNADQGSIESLNYLDRSIKALMNSTEQKCFIPIYIQPNRVFVGFDSGSRDTADPCSTILGSTIKKPLPLCGVDACVCLCDGGSGSISQDDCLSAIQCYSYKKILQFRTRDNEGKILDMALYGESCWFGVNEGAGSTVIEKSMNAGGIYDTVHVYRTENVEGIKLCDELFKFDDLQEI